MVPYFPLAVPYFPRCPNFSQSQFFNPIIAHCTARKKTTFIWSEYRIQERRSGLPKVLHQNSLFVVIRVFYQALCLVGMVREILLGDSRQQRLGQCVHGSIHGFACRPVFGHDLDGGQPVYCRPLPYTAEQCMYEQRTQYFWVPVHVVLILILMLINDEDGDELVTTTTTMTTTTIMTIDYDDDDQGRTQGGGVRGYYPPPPRKVPTYPPNHSAE